MDTAPSDAPRQLSLAFARPERGSIAAQPRSSFQALPPPSARPHRGALKVWPEKLSHAHPHCWVLRLVRPPFEPGERWTVRHCWQLTRWLPLHRIAHEVMDASEAGIPGPRFARPEAGDRLQLWRPNGQLEAEWSCAPVWASCYSEEWVRTR